MEIKTEALYMDEKQAWAANGFAALFLGLLILVGACPLLFYGAFGVVLALVLAVVACFLLAGLKILKPNEAYVLTLFGKYYGTLRGPGFFFVNPFVRPFYPSPSGQHASAAMAAGAWTKKISLKAITLDNEKQKINDSIGNPIIIGIIVIWKVANTAKAVFNVENYMEFLSIQADSALRNIVRLYPYDVSHDNDNEKTLRGSSLEISAKLRDEIQKKTEIAGLEIIEATITHLSYAPEIASAMLQRQQASAVVDARQMIVEGAVGMVEMALSKLNESSFVQLDEERKASMVSNLLVVLCGNRDAQPIVNSGSIY